MEVKAVLRGGALTALNKIIFIHGANQIEGVVYLQR